MRAKYLGLLLWTLAVYALIVFALWGQGGEVLDQLHLGLDTSNAILSMLLAVFLLGERHTLLPAVRNYLAIGFGFAAGTELLHALIGIEWTGAMAWIGTYSGTLRPATWPPSTYVLPLSMTWAWWLMQRNATLSPSVFAAGMAVLTFGLTALSLYLPRYVDTGLLGIQRPTQLPLLFVWAGVIVAYWRQRHAHRLFEGLALMGVVLFLSDLLMLYSTAPHEKFAMMAHAGKLLAYGFVHLIQMLVAAEDGRARDAAEAALLEEQSRLKAALTRLRIAAVAFDSQEGMVVTDAQGVIQQVNRAFTEDTGYTPEDVAGQTPRILKSGRHDVDFYRAMWDQISLSGSWQGEIWDRRKNGDIYPKWLNISAVKDEQGTVTHYVGTHFDISERKKAEEKIRRLAFFDQLTGLPNRFSLHEHLAQALRLATRNERSLALMLIDLDNFKTINDTLGHQAGDRLLVCIAERLSGSVRESDLVARLGGDEFVIVLENFDLPSDVAHVAQKILAATTEPCVVDGQELRTSPSIGICLFPDDAHAAEDLIKKADVAMYHAKARGKAHYQFFREEIQTEAVRRLTIEVDLRKALKRQEFVLHYQPQIDLRSGRLSGVEALLRWQHPEHGLVPPLEFVPVAETTGLIVPIGNWVIEEAARQMAEWRGRGMSDVQVSVNLAAPQFADHSLPETIGHILERTGLPAGCLDLEVTESMTMESPTDSVATMNTLTRLGLSLSIDDFGTGYSSLAYLKLFPIQTLKIDRSFVRDIETDQNDADICDVIVLLAHKLGLQVVAEGVETEAQLKYLLSIGCEKIQGYLISKPLPASVAEQFIRTYRPSQELGTTVLWAEA